MSLVVKTAGDPLHMADAIKAAVWAIDPDRPVRDVQALENIVRGSADQERFNMSILSALSGLSLLLAAVGLYGILAYGVSLRTRELGIRLALGASPGGLVKLVLSEGVRIALGGTAFGVAGALLLSRLTAKLLYGVRPADPPTYCTIAAIVIGVSLLATYIPARRAARLDAMDCLRVE
jgi:putative ABC transport system permease protein